VSKRSTTARTGWKDASVFGSTHKDTDIDTQGSQERIVGITKTVDVRVVRGLGGEGEQPEGRPGRNQFGEAV
jgi:hypothetical protein